MLPVGPPGAGGSRIAPDEVFKRLQKVCESAFDQAEGVTHLEDEPGVGNVLGSGAAVDMAPELRRKRILQGGHERDYGCAGQGRAAAKGLKVKIGRL